MGSGIIIIEISYNVVLAARNQVALEKVKAECEASGAQALVVPTDTSDPKAMIALANTAIDWQNRIDVLLNNGGVLAARDFDQTPMAVHEQVIKTNLLGYMNGAHAVLPFFKEQAGAPSSITFLSAVFCRSLTVRVTQQLSSVCAAGRRRSKLN